MLESVIVNCFIDSLFVRIIINERTDAWHRQVVTVGNPSHKRVKGFVSVLGSDGPFYPLSLYSYQSSVTTNRNL
mgnify:CR=1 FL=1